MNMEPLEQRLTRYAPSGPAPSLKADILSGVLSRERARRRVSSALTLAALLLLTATILNFHANRIYEEAIEIASGKPRPAAAQTVATASILSVEMPGARDLLRWNGGSNE